MKELLEKLSSYKLFNYLFPGVLFAAFGEQLTTYSFIHDNIIVGLFVYYFIGLVVSRIGSLILEPLLKRIHFLHFSTYTDFVYASKVNDKIEILSEANNSFRTLTSVFLCLMCLRFFEFLEKTYPSISEYSNMFTLLLLVVLFVFSYRKQTNYINAQIRRTILAENTEDVNDMENTQ